ncbi:MAG: hypothetical protein ABJD53_17485 [Gammaproteobacteria bacterium]
MRLIDRIIQCREPFVVESTIDGSRTRLSGAMDAAADLEHCPIRYVLDDTLTSLCTDLAYSNGVTVMACADLIRVPAENIWVEWCNKPWLQALRRNAMNAGCLEDSTIGHFGVLIRSSTDGRNGLIRAFWSGGDSDLDIHASAAQSRFYLDSPVPAMPPAEPGILRVAAAAIDPQGLLSRSFHFEFEGSWAKYYREATHDASHQREILHHSIGCVALAVPVLLAFLLLLMTRDGLPQRATQLERLNRARIARGRMPLADHIEVSAPLLQPYREAQIERASAGARRHPRLHHVRGHLIRRNDRLFWRVPHLRGNADAGIIKSRTVEWRFDQGATQRRKRSSLGSMP